MARPNLPDALAAGLMVLVMARDYAWTWVPPAVAGMASKGLGALLVLAVLPCVWWMAGLLKWPRRWLAWPIGYGCWSALQTALCSAAWMVEPWPVVEGRGICAGRIDLDLAALGLLIAAAWAVLASPVRVDSGPTDKMSGQ